MDQVNSDIRFKQDANSLSSDKSKDGIYQIMHMDKTVAEISYTGEASR